MGAVRDVDRTLLTVARSYGARPWQVYVKVILPAIVPSVLASLRLGIVFCLLGVLIVEMFAGVRGMGSVMGGLANGFRAPELFAATGLVSVASIAIVLGLDHLNEKLSHWRGWSARRDPSRHLRHGRRAVRHPTPPRAERRAPAPPPRHPS